MKKHIRIVRKKSIFPLIFFPLIFICLCIFLFNINTFFGILSLIPVFICVIICAVMSWYYISREGIFIDSNIVIFHHGEYGKTKFHVNEIKEIYLGNFEMIPIDYEMKTYKYRYIIFHLKSGRKKKYYAGNLTKKKYTYIKNFILSLRTK